MKARYYRWGSLVAARYVHVGAAGRCGDIICK